MEASRRSAASVAAVSLARARASRSSTGANRRGSPRRGGPLRVLRPPPAPPPPTRRPGTRDRRALRPATASSGGVRADLGDLERDRGRSARASARARSPRRWPFRSASARGGVGGCPKRRERLVPRLGVGVRERGRAILERQRLRGDARRVVPDAAGAARDHRHEPGRERDRERGGRPASGRAARASRGRRGRPSGSGRGSSRRPRQDESTTARAAFIDFGAVPLYLTEKDVAELIEPADAVEAIEECFRRMARGLRRDRAPAPSPARGGLARGHGGVRPRARARGREALRGGGGRATFVVCLFDAETTELVAVMEADQLGRLRTGAASGVAARYLARGGARTLGVIGCGHQAETQVACVRAAVPSLERVVGYCRTPERLAAFCERVGAEPAESHSEAGAQDVVVTITSSRDPVLRGEWLVPGALVVGAGANVPEPTRARQRRARARALRVLRLARAGAPRVRRPDRAGRRRACSTGSRCTSCTRSSRGRSPAASPTTTSSSSSRTGSRRGTSRSARRSRSSGRASARSRKPQRLAARG